MTKSERNKWLDRLIPLPKEISISGSITAQAGEIGVELQAGSQPPLETALAILRSFALSRGDDAAFKIRLGLLDSQNAAVSADLRARLKDLPNSDQAYAILPLENGEGLLLVSNTPVGLLYAAHTLAQLVCPPAGITAATRVEIPLVSITDWPDLPERGQWGGNVNDDLEWTSRWKLNVIESSASPWIDADGNTQIRISRDLFRQGSRLGVKIVPIIIHLEQLVAYSGIERNSDMVSTPDPSKPLPSDYIPGLCSSSTATGELMSVWLDKIADIDGVTDICVWLSEDESKCFCQKCRDKEPYLLEVACIVGAYRRIQPKHPGLRLRLLLSQGSYPVNDKVLAAKPDDVCVTYYDGGRTYDSSRNPMIYPLLERYSVSGKWLGCYPQITHSWRTVFPWTAPQFIRFRAGEFVQKRLDCMIGYTVPSNRYHEFNVMAMAEWTWNAEGRTAEEFARAYATVTGVGEPDLFARWAAKAGEAGWSLAETNMLCYLIYDPSVGLVGEVPVDHRFEKAGIVDIDQFYEALSFAREALDLANESGNEDMICESECALSGLEAFRIIRAAVGMIREGVSCNGDEETLAELLNGLNQCARTLRTRLLEWGERVRIRAGEKRLNSRLLDAAFILFRTADVLREEACRLGLVESSSEPGLVQLGQWSEQDFAGTAQPVLRFDLTDLVPREGGSYQLGVDYIDSAYGTDILRAAVVEIDDAGERILAESPDCPDKVSIWERWAELRLEIPRRGKGTKLWFEVEISGLPEDAPEGRRTCAGTIGLRRIS